MPSLFESFNMDWITFVALVLLIVPSSDAACGSSLGQFPCPPEFPDWMALFPRTIAALGTSQVAQLQNEAVTLAQENNVSISFCIEKLNVGEINARLNTSNPVDIDATCHPVTSTMFNPITTLTTGSRRVSTQIVALFTSPSPNPSIKPLETTIVDRTPSPTIPQTTVSSTLTLHHVTSTNAILNSTASSKTDHVIVTDAINLASSSASISVPLETPRSGQKLFTNASDEGSARAVVITALVCTLVIVPVVLIAAFLICFFAHRYLKKTGSSRTSKTCLDILPRRTGRTGNANITTPTGANSSPDRSLAANRQVVRNLSVYSANSTNSATQLIDRSDSILSGDVWTVDSPHQAITPGLITKPSIRALATVDESLEPASTERRTDPLHRRTIQPVEEADWQRTMPSTNHRRGGRRHDPSSIDRLTLSGDLLNRIDQGDPFENNINPPFHLDSSGLTTGNGNTSSESIPDIYKDDDHDSDVVAIWEKFDDAEKMAIEVEMGSHQAIM